MAKPSVFEQYAAATAQFIASVKPVEAHVAFFKPALKLWHQSHGSKLSPELLTVAVMLTSKYASPGVECLSTAMQLRPNEGYTVDQYTSIGTTARLSPDGRPTGPANNKRKALLKAGYIDVTATGKPYRFQAVLTPKGIKFLQNLISHQAVQAEGAAVEAKPAKAVAKAKGKRKAKKATVVAPAQTPTSEAPEATVTVDPAVNDQPVEFELIRDEPVQSEPVTTDQLTALADHFNQA